LKAGRWRTGTEVAAWLRRAHGIERARKSIYYHWHPMGGKKPA
jgi:hypothetical protein